MTKTSEESTDREIFSSVPTPSTAPYHLPKMASQMTIIYQLIICRQYFPYIWDWPSKLGVEVWSEQSLQKRLWEVLWHLQLYTFLKHSTILRFISRKGQTELNPSLPVCLHGVPPSWRLPPCSPRCWSGWAWPPLTWRGRRWSSSWGSSGRSLSCTRRRCSWTPGLTPPPNYRLDQNGFTGKKDELIVSDCPSQASSQVCWLVCHTFRYLMCDILGLVKNHTFPLLLVWNPSLNDVIYFLKDITNSLLSNGRCWRCFGFKLIAYADAYPA